MSIIVYENPTTLNEIECMVMIYCVDLTELKRLTFKYSPLAVWLITFLSIFLQNYFESYILQLKVF